MTWATARSLEDHNRSVIEKGGLIEMKYCKNCVMPDTKPDLSFDEDGVCIACRATEMKHNKIDWNARKKELGTIFSEHKSSDPKRYDCIVPVSGGKDSTFQALIVRDEYKMHPLCVHFEPTFPSPIGRRNLENLRNLGFDILSFKPNRKVYNKIGREMFRRVGDHEWLNHVGIFTVPVRIAVQFGIKLIIWGENSQLEYGGSTTAANRNILDRRWLEEFGGLLGFRVSDLKEIGISEMDITPYHYPSNPELKNAGITGIFLGYYLKWDARKQVDMVKWHGFSVRDEPVEGTYTNYENLDDEIVSIHDYFKYIKFGFGRASDHASLDIRNGRLSRKDALALVARYDGDLPKLRIKMFCEHFSMEESEFYSIVSKFANKTIFKTDMNGELIWKNGKPINIPFEKELEKNGITEDDLYDNNINRIVTKIDEQTRR